MRIQQARDEAIYASRPAILLFLCVSRRNYSRGLPLFSIASHLSQLACVGTWIEAHDAL